MNNGDEAQEASGGGSGAVAPGRSGGSGSDINHFAAGTALDDDDDGWVEIVPLGADTRGPSIEEF